jgi:cholesterol transport system auxiliary component
MTRALLTAAACAAFVTGGCVSLLPETQPDTLYRLAGVDLNAAAPGTAPVTVLIDRIAAPRGLAGDRIALVRGDAIAYMAGAAWITPAPQLMESAVVDAFYETAAMIAPARTTDGVSARYELDVELRHFEAEYDQGEGSAPLVRTALRARLIDRDSRTLLGARTVERTVRASANRQSAIVAAFSRSAGDAARDLAGWTEEAVCRSDDAPQACPQ